MDLRNRLLAGIALAGLLPGAAFADDAAEAPGTAVQELVITATGKSQATSSTKTETPLIETPQSISIITREEMDVRAVHTVSDALAYTAGVQSESFGIDSRVDEVSVRGFSAGGFSSSNNFVDGLRLPSGGQWTRPAFDPFGLQQVEVLKGPSSVLYGQVAPGGLVNQVSKRPEFVFGGELMAQAAGYTDLGRWQYQLAGDVTGPLNAEGTLAFRVVGLARDGETQIKETENSRYFISPSLTWKPTDATSLTVLGQYQRDEGGSTYQFLPATGTLRQSNGRRIELDAYLGEPDWNRFDRDQYLIASFFEHQFSDSLKLRNNLRYTHLDTLYRVTVLAGDTVTNCGAIAGCIPGQTINRRAVQGKGESDGFAVDTQLEGKFTTGPLSHTVLAGLDYFHTDWEHYRDLVRANLVLPLLDFYNPAPRGSAAYAANMSPQVYTETVSKQTGLYAQDQIEVGNLRIAVGGRQDWAKDDAYNPVTRATTITKADAFTWRVGAVHLFDNGLAPYASYSESFQPSTGQYFDGTPFDPTTGQQLEAGIRFQPPGSNIFLTFAAYEITQQNITTPDPDPTHICGGGTCSVQTGEGRIRGLEFEGKATLADGFTLVATATKSEGEVTKTNTVAQRGKDLPNVPDGMASLFVDYRFQEASPLQGLGVGGGVRWVGKSWGDTLNTLAIPDYTMVDAFVRYDLGQASPALDGITASLNVRNLANKTYVATCGSTASCYYGSGRTVNLRLQYRW
ncbi:MAG: TonB-dependent siderophore receptor [Pseudomonadota bacterium]